MSGSFHHGSLRNWHRALYSQQMHMAGQTPAGHWRKKMAKINAAGRPLGGHFATKCGNLVHCMCIFYNDLHRFWKKLCSTRLPTCPASTKLRWSSRNEARLKNVTPWKWPKKKCLRNVESVNRVTLLVVEGSGRSGVQWFYGRFCCVA